MESATGAHRADGNDTTVWWYFIRHIASIKRSARGTSISFGGAGAALPPPRQQRPPIPANRYLVHSGQQPDTPLRPHRLPPLLPRQDGAPPPPSNALLFTPQRDLKREIKPQGSPLRAPLVLPPLHNEIGQTVVTRPGSMRQSASLPALAVARIRAETSTTATRDLFASADVNKDGRLDRDEFKRFLQRGVLGTRVRASECYESM